MHWTKRKALNYLLNIKQFLQWHNFLCLTVVFAATEIQSSSLKLWEPVGSPGPDSESWALLSASGPGIYSPQSSEYLLSSGCFISIKSLLFTLLYTLYYFRCLQCGAGHTGAGCVRWLAPSDQMTGAGCRGPHGRGRVSVRDWHQTWAHGTLTHGAVIIISNIYRKLNCYLELYKYSSIGCGTFAENCNEEQIGQFN